MKNQLLLIALIGAFTSLNAQREFQHLQTKSELKVPSQVSQDFDKRKVPSQAFMENVQQKGVLNLFEALDTAFDLATSDSETKGFTAAIVTPDGSVWERAAGVSQETPSIELLTTEHLMGMASNTKSFVAATILLMYEDGLLDLDDPLEMYLDPMTNIPGNATIRQLLNHRSGISDFLNDNEAWFDDYLAYPDSMWTIEALIDAYVLEPNFPVDSDWSYSNTGYLLAALILEEMTGEPWYVEVRDRVIDPLGLTSTFAYPYEQPTGQELAYLWDIDFQSNFDAVGLEGWFSMAASAGCLISTAEDLALFRKALHGGDLLQEATLEEIQTDYSPGYNPDYGLGVFSYNNWPIDNWGHNGDWSFLSRSAYFPEYDFSVATMQNQWNTYPDVLNALDLMPILTNAYLNYYEAVSNDDICDAISLPTDGTVGVYSNLGTLMNAEEDAIIPPQPGCQTQVSWCNDEGITNSVWFTFVSTASEATLTTCHDGTTFDTQLAVYSGTDCSDFGTLTLVGANDDVPGGCDFGLNIYASELNLTGLANGETYWVLVDGWSTAFGDFGISVSQDAVGLNESQTIEFGMSPNPADETLCISSPEDLDRISIIDMQGRNVISQAGMFREIDISQLAAGIYQVGVTAGNRISFQKLVVE